MSQPEARSQAADASAAAPARILVVDDDPQLCRLLERLLHRDGHSVTVVEDAGEAAALLDGETHALWLVDATVEPTGAGPLVERALAMPQSSRPGLVLISGKPPAPELAKRLDAAAGVFLSKPFAPAELRRIVALALRGREG